MTISEDEVWAFLDEAGAIFTEATGRELSDFDSDDDWQECCLKFFREMADEMKQHGITWDKEEGEYRSTLRTELSRVTAELQGARDRIKQLNQSLEDEFEERRDAAAEARWQERQGDEYGTF